MTKNPYDFGKKNENPHLFSFSCDQSLLRGISELGLLFAVAIVFLLFYLGYRKFNLGYMKFSLRFRKFYDKQIKIFL